MKHLTHVLLFIVLSVSCLKASAQPGNNNFANATDVTSQINNTCTTGGAYTTQAATGDQTKPACWSNGPNNNVWFKFTATPTGFINVKVKASGSGETIQYPFVAIFDASANPLACQNYQGSKTDLSLSYLGLTPGSTYYISVDNYAGYAGSFDLCLSDVVDYDFKQGAKDVTSQINSSCTSGGTYTTQFATPDQSKASCWSNGPNNNVWFKFTATATGFINAKVKISGSGETIQYPFVAIYDASNNQLACQNYQGSKTDLSLSYLGLTPGNTYYITVDNYAGYAGSFDLCLSDVVDYDFKLGAKDVTSIINACTSGGTYTTQFATPDQSKASCWSNGPNNNVWFKFTATATGFINAKVKVSGTGETLQYPFLAIYDASTSQLTCQNYQGNKTDLSLSYLGLTPGNTYYIGVDNYAGYAGSFDLCLSDVVDYDFKQGATDVTPLINSCTSGGTYTTQFATPDQSKASCWSNGPNNNVWFKFTATATGFINAKVKVSSTGETLQNPAVAIYDASTNQLACQNLIQGKTDLSLSYLGLTPGNTYYIAVDNYAGYAGSFDLCLSDVVDYDYKQGAKDVTAQINSCTSGGTYTTLYGTPDGSKPSCWSNGPNNNVWFKFTATSTGFINAKVKVSGTGETMQNPFVAIYDASSSLLTCQNFLGAKTDLSLSYLGLTPGNTYYIAVDNYAGYIGSFDLCLSDVVDYDYKQGAKDVTSQINSCTSGGTYTTLYATPDQSKPGCWSNGPNSNVWFQFTATSTGFINTKVKVSGSGESMQNPFVAIYDASLNLLNCQNYKGAKTDLSLSYYGLTPGSTYYIAVDNYVGYRGSFDLCLSDVPDYDYKQGALDVSGQMNSVTSGGAYSTFYATPDQSKASCWSNGPNNNVWFKFTAATAGITAGVKVSGSGETMQNPFLAIYDASLNQLGCQNYSGAKTDLSITYTSLTPGNTYYIVVDNYAGYAGSFDLAVYDNMMILPLKLTSFTASASQKQVNINWSTTQEENIHSFTIQRAATLPDFKDIGQIPPSAQTNYTFIDNTPLPGDNYYRLKTTETSGTTSYSSTARVNYTSAAPISFTLYPNPSSSKEPTWIRIENTQNLTPIIINIYDMLGRTLSTQTQNLTNPGPNLIRLPITQRLNTGCYNVTITNARNGDIIDRQQLLIK
ncbi:MAG: T9SS type A sorting domain-containing protein [Bacteroidetes bacterium]|nr:T9SS type A sorting domain-containing protein [Bacteroidota bacterium]